MSNGLPTPPSGEHEITDGDEIVYRSVGLAHFDDGEPNWQAFYPTKADPAKLSVSRSSVVTAFGAYLQRSVFLAERFKAPPVGSWALSVKAIQTLEARAVDDWAPQRDLRNLGHAYIDFGHCPDKPAVKDLAKSLRDVASRSYPTPDNGQDDSDG